MKRCGFAELFGLWPYWEDAPDLCRRLYAQVFVCPWSFLAGFVFYIHPWIDFAQACLGFAVLLAWYWHSSHRHIGISVSHDLFLCLESDVVYFYDFILYIFLLSAVQILWRNHLKYKISTLLILHLMRRYGRHLGIMEAPREWDRLFREAGGYPKNHGGYIQLLEVVLYVGNGGYLEQG